MMCSTAAMSWSLLVLIVSITSTVFSNKCDPISSIKQWQHYSPCAHQTEHGVLIGFGYNINQPHAKDDLAIIGIEYSDIPNEITQEYSECDCEKSACLTDEQSQWLFDISVDRAQKQVSNLVKSTRCCDIQTALTELFFTFGTRRLMTVPGFIFDANDENWEKLGSKLLMQNWCKTAERCGPLGERIIQGCQNVVEGNLGCSPPTPKACDQTGNYCCATNNTCCQNARNGKQKMNNIVNNSYWCCPLSRAVCCTGNSCCPAQNPVCCGGTASCCSDNYPVCCFPGTFLAYCCAASSPVCVGSQHCGSLNPEIPPVKGNVSNRKYK